jgi:hypothetical protein
LPGKAKVGKFLAMVSILNNGTLTAETALHLDLVACAEKSPPERQALKHPC